MALVLDGSANTIGGLSVGGLPDGSVALADLATTGTASNATFLRGDGAFAAAGGGKFESYAVIADQKSQNTQGGTFSAGAWRTRDLNTEIADADNIVTISSNQFTLGAGSYLIRGSASVYRTNGHQTRIYNDTDSSIVAVGTDEMSHNSFYTMNRSFVSGRVTITGNTVFELQHRCATGVNTYGYGQRNNFGVEQYALVEIFKES
tara:strand:+ start:165 stop:779 length:615 start_codon:yes stop_codon:yes gene_type:complete